MKNLKFYINNVVVALFIALSFQSVLAQGECSLDALNSELVTKNSDEVFKHFEASPEQAYDAWKVLYKADQSADRLNLDILKELGEYISLTSKGLKVVEDEIKAVGSFSSWFNNSSGISKSNFYKSFQSSEEVQLSAWILYKEKNWAELEKLFTDNNIKWPPAYGGYNIEKISLSKGMKFDRYTDDSAGFENDIPIFRSGFTSPLKNDGTPYEFAQRALDRPKSDYDFYYEIEVLKDLPFEGELADVIPWFGLVGNGKQTSWDIPVESSGYPKTFSQLAEEGYIKITIKDSPSGKYSSLVGDVIGRVEIDNVREKVLAKKTHVLSVEGLNKTRNYQGNELKGFTGCHTEKALQEFVENNGGSYFIKNKPNSLSNNEVYEGQPIIIIENIAYVKTNGKIVEYEPGKFAGTSTFFPENWSITKILQEVEYAIQNNRGKVPGNNKNEYYGFSEDGNVEIHFYLNQNGEIGSYFPVKK
ncbi:EndoU domain-containing protein [Aquimarina brevivitae]|uniref:Uncharacterized protein DUF4237 n=1 Tax=Aquimarina brevivitae TaxID=323412 RepID=A0A4Q7NYC4_9FLAO|nr:EndoU domain-containing protein [Aquimarina brevivitae]RZS92436.1 uncharacterized protein DUF4237 [Aquimarina brevivitae]